MTSQIASVSDDQAAESDADYRGANFGARCSDYTGGIVQAETVPQIAETSWERRERKRRETEKDGVVARRREIMPIFSIRTSAVHL
jgi:hypothetical protein